MSVARAMAAIVVNDQVIIPDGEISVAFVRASGPGGQNINKVASKVELRWTPGTTTAVDTATRARLVERLASRLTTTGELIVTSSLTRDQGRNRDDAGAKLAAIVRAGLAVPKRRRATQPTRRSRERRLADKKRHSLRKQSRRTPPQD